MNLHGSHVFHMKAKLLDRASDIQPGGPGSNLGDPLRWDICAVFEGYKMIQSTSKNHEKSIETFLKRNVVFFNHLSMLLFCGFRSNMSCCVFFGAAWFVTNFKHWFRIGLHKNGRLPATTVCYHVPFWLREWCEEQGAELLQEVLDELHSCKKQCGFRML